MFRREIAQRKERRRRRLINLLAQTMLLSELATATQVLDILHADRLDDGDELCEHGSRFFGKKIAVGCEKPQNGGLLGRLGRMLVHEVDSLMENEFYKPTNIESCKKSSLWGRRGVRTLRLHLWGIIHGQSNKIRHTRMQLQ